MAQQYTIPADQVYSLAQNMIVNGTTPTDWHNPIKPVWALNTNTGKLEVVQPTMNYSDPMMPPNLPAGYREVPQDPGYLAKLAVDTGSITPEQIAQNHQDGKVNPDGSLTFTSTADKPDWSGDLMVGAAMAAAGSAGFWAPGMTGAGSLGAIPAASGATEELAALGGYGATPELATASAPVATSVAPYVGDLPVDPSAGASVGQLPSANYTSLPGGDGDPILSDPNGGYGGDVGSTSTGSPMINPNFGDGGASAGFASTALGKVLDGSASAADYASVLGGVGGIASSLFGLNAAKKLGSTASNLPPASSFGTYTPPPALSDALRITGLPVGATASTLGISPFAVPGTPGAASFTGVDPWGESGGRDLAATQLKALLADPSSITGTPGYEAGLQAVQRSMAAQGYNGSGNMMAALQKYGGQFYNDAVARLSPLAATNQNPATAANLALTASGQQVTARGQDLNYLTNQGAQTVQSQGQQLSYLTNQGQQQLTNQGQQMNYTLGQGQLQNQALLGATNLTSQSLGSLGYGTQSLFGNSGVQMTPAVQKFLQGLG